MKGVTYSASCLLAPWSSGSLGCPKAAVLTDLTWLRSQASLDTAGPSSGDSTLEQYCHLHSGVPAESLVSLKQIRFEGIY